MSGVPRALVMMAALAALAAPGLPIARQLRVTDGAPPISDRHTRRRRRKDADAEREPKHYRRNRSRMGMGGR